jgi:hypothetical protein
MNMGGECVFITAGPLFRVRVKIRGSVSRNNVNATRTRSSLAQGRRQESRITCGVRWAAACHTSARGVPDEQTLLSWAGT